MFGPAPRGTPSYLIETNFDPYAISRLFHSQIVILALTAPCLLLGLHSTARNQTLGAFGRDRPNSIFLSGFRFFMPNLT